MAKPKAKKNVRKKVSKQKVFLIVAGVMVIVLGLFVVIKAYELNKIENDQRTALDESLVATQSLYNQFLNITPELKQKAVFSQNSCTRVSAKYSNDYSCGNNFVLVVTQISEDRFKQLNQQLTAMYQNDNDFTDTKSYELELSSDKDKISAVVGGSFKETEAKCYVSSEYSLMQRTATFNGGCSLTSQSRLFAVKD